MTYDALVEKTIKHEKAFGKKIVESPSESLWIAQKGKHQDMYTS